MDARRRLSRAVRRGHGRAGCGERAAARRRAVRRCSSWRPDSQTRDTRGAGGVGREIAQGLRRRSRRQIRRSDWRAWSKARRRRTASDRAWDCSSAARSASEFELVHAEYGSPDERPWLLFIHGTGSTTWGSFGELWSEARQPQLWRLRDLYGDRVLAFEHRTLTHSPLRNARDLLAELTRVIPGGAPLHIVTHSRGGLVGELLCRGEVTDEELDLFTPRCRSGGQPRGSPHADGAARRAAGADRSRSSGSCASPVRRSGTTLASGRLDRWLSVIGTLAGFLARQSARRHVRGPRRFRRRGDQGAHQSGDAAGPRGDDARLAVHQAGELAGRRRRRPPGGDRRRHRSGASGGRGSRCGSAIGSTKGTTTWSSTRRRCMAAPADAGAPSSAPTRPTPSTTSPTSRRQAAPNASDGRAGSDRTIRSGRIRAAAASRRSPIARAVPAGGRGRARRLRAARHHGQRAR